MDNTVIDHKLAWDTFVEIKALVDAWTKDHRGCARLSNVVTQELYKLAHYDELNHDVKMTVKQRDNIVDCLRILVGAADHSTSDHRGLAEKAMVVLNTLNVLFEKEGLEKVKGHF
jgi:hypothetical protein